LKAKTLYICYFGIREPLVQTQVLPYLRELGKDGQISVSLLTFEPNRSEADLSDFEKIGSDLGSESIDWKWLPYHKRPSAIATAWDVFCGVRAIQRSISGLDFLHARSHVPMLMAAIARKLSRDKPKIIFDIRGFMPEEYADAGVWNPDGAMFRLAKRIEGWLMRQADGFVVLTEKARSLVFPVERRPVEVIPCCVDMKKRFNFDRARLRNEMREKLGITDRYVIVHAGALGGLYLTDRIAELLAAARDEDPSAFAMFLTQSDPMLIRPLLVERGFDEKDMLLTKVPPGEIAAYLCAADVGLSFVKSSYATQSRSPTKIPEYLACGLPIIANAGVGDVDELIDNYSIGSIVRSFDFEGYMRALEDIKTFGNIEDRCREAAKTEFDLESVGGVRYRRLYSRLTSSIE
jgi:glycosyltransferase involved in cell wall biosynthesis